MDSNLRSMVSYHVKPPESYYLSITLIFRYHQQIINSIGFLVGRSGINTKRQRWPCDSPRHMAFFCFIASPVAISV